MVHFIELTQICDDLHRQLRRIIKVSVEQICFYCSQHIVFNNRAIDVVESYAEITNLINKAMEE